MDKCKPIKTPMLSNGHLDLDGVGKSADQTFYRFMIGSLLYLIASRPNIMFSVCMCARFKLILRRLTQLLLKESLGTLNTHQALVFGIPKELDFNQLAIPFRIMLVAKLIEKTHPEGAICLVDHQCLGPPRSKIVWHCPPPRQSTLSWVLVVHKFFK